MIEYKEYKVGEIFEIDGVKLQCIERAPCVNCYFFDKHSQCYKQLCNPLKRRDKKNVIFKQIKE